MFKKLAISVLWYCCSTALFANAENSFQRCASHLALGGYPKVEIHIQGEVHTKPELAMTPLVARTEAGEIFLLVEGAPYGTSKAFSALAHPATPLLQFNAEGPFFGIEHPLATLLQELQLAYFKLEASAFLNSPERFYSKPENESLWLRLVDIAARNPRYFRAVRNDPAARGAEIFDTIQSLVALGSPEQALRAMRERGAYPKTISAHASSVRVFLHSGLNALEASYPFLSGWFANTRSALESTSLPDPVAATGDLIMVRDFFICESVAKIVAKHFQAGKPFVLIVGGNHVTDVARILKSEFSGLENIQITVDEANEARDPQFREVHSDVLNYLTSRQPPSPNPPTP